MPSLNMDILEKVRGNPYFRQELLTNEYTQVVEMSIEPGSDTGERVDEGDVALVVVDGCGAAVLNRRHSLVKPGSLVAIAAGTRYNIINAGNAPLKLAAVYAPPQETPGTVYRTRDEALAANALAANALAEEDAVEARKNGDGNARP